MRRTAFSLLFFCLAQAVHGQIYPLRSQLFFAPAFHNSAFTGISRQTEISLIHRQQWLGIKDAPVTMGVNIQYPMLGRLAMGFTVLSSESVLLRNSSGMLTAAYEIPFDEDHLLRFGLSAGVGMSKLEVPEGYDDPVVGRNYPTSFSLQGNAGIAYKYKKLWASFSLPTLFRDEPMSNDDFVGGGFRALDHYQAALGYKVRLDAFENFTLDPYIVFLHYDHHPNVAEGVIRFVYKNIAWAGIGYSSQSQASGFVGAEIVGRVGFNYSYDFSIGDSGLSQPSHEIQVSFKLGKPKVRRSGQSNRAKQTAGVGYSNSDTVSIDSVQQFRPDDAAVQRNAPDEDINEPQPARPYDEVSTPDRNTSSVQNRDTLKEVFQLNRDSGFPSGYYLIAGVFTSKENASRLNNSLSGKGYSPVIRLHQGKQYYYVIIYSSLDQTECMLQYEIVKKLPEFSDAWIFHVK